MPAGAITSFGYSNTSLEDALRVAEERANQIASRIAGPTPLESYDYLSGPLREEVIEELSYNDKIAAAITRNAYGALVLNTSQVVIADIDLPRPPFFKWLMSLFQKSRDTATAQLLERIDALCSQRRDLGIRLYRTKLGYRAVVTSQTMVPDSGEANEFLQSMGSDTLYSKLCTTQESFRARLTPKPWRINMNRPPCRYPYASQSDQQQMQRWISDYELNSKSYVACALVGQFGNPTFVDEVAQVLKVHDLYACGNHEPLA